MEGNVENFIKAITSYGGDEYCDYEQYYTEENEKEFYKWLKKQPKMKDVTLWRGYTFDEQYYEDGMIKVGKTVDINALTQMSMPSFTKSSLRAVNYMRDFGEIDISGTVRVLFKVQTKGKYIVDISRLSHYTYESECKCTPNAKFKVTEIKPHGGFVEIILEEK